MKKFILLFVCIVSFSGAQENTGIRIIPEPQSVVTKPVKFKISSTTRVVLGSGNGSEQFIAQQLNDELLQLGDTPLRVMDEQSVRKLASNYFFIGKPDAKYGKKFLLERKGALTPEMKAEGYFLDVDAKGVVIIAESEKGLFYGMMSLLQLIKKEKRSIVVPGATIHDFPALKIRGICDNISAGQIPTMENVKKNIRFCARYKMNIYSPLWLKTFALNSDMKRFGALTQTEGKELDAFAKKYFVEIIPAIEFLQPNATNSRLDEIIAEAAQHFSSPYFILTEISGNDSVAAMGNTNDSLFLTQIKRAIGLAKKYGKKPIVQSDILLKHPEIRRNILRDGTILIAQEAESASQAANFEFPFIAFSSINSDSSLFPNYFYSLPRIQRNALHGSTAGSLGMLVSSYAKLQGITFRELHYYGFIWSAECAWNPAGAEQFVFTEKFFEDFFSTSETDMFRSVYLLLSSPVNYVGWNEIWETPMNIPWERVQSIQATMPFVLNVLDKLQSIVLKNAEHLFSLQFVARTNLLVAKQMEVQEVIRTLWKDSVSLSGSKREKILSKVNEIVADLATLKADFQKLWLLTNRPQGLESFLTHYDDRIEYWNKYLQ